MVVVFLSPWWVNMDGDSNGKKWSGKRGSNPRPLAWEANALPPELFPQLFCLKILYLNIVKLSTKFF